MLTPLAEREGSRRLLQRDAKQLPRGRFLRLVGGMDSFEKAGDSGFLIAILGLACELFAESLFIGGQPDRIELSASLGSLLSGGAANGLYTIAVVMLTLATHSLRPQS